MRTIRKIMFRGSIFIAASFVLGISVNAQQVNPASYFPLQLENEWTFIHVLYPPFAPPDTTWFAPNVIGSTESINDTLYYAFDSFPLLATRFRSNESGKVWTRLVNQDQLLFDFTLDDGESYFIRLGEADQDQYEVSIERKTQIEVPIGELLDVVTFHFKPVQPRTDSDYHFTFASGVGLVQYSFGGWTYGALHSASIGGVLITSIEEATYPKSRELEIYAFPNPFQSSTSFSVPYWGNQMPEVRITDVLGRMVAKLEPGFCSATACKYTWNGSQHANGIYLVALLTDHTPELFSVVLNK